MRIYADKSQAYFSSARIDLIQLIPSSKYNRILEIGAGGGDTLVAIKEMNLARETVGVELFDMPYTNQNHPDIDRFIIGNVEDLELGVEADYFDVILCGDVLEHLIDPWSVINKLTICLKPGGTIIASIPNFREFKTLYKILFDGDFAYSEAGILDKTHLRFFCKKNLIELFTTKELQVVEVRSNIDAYPAITKTKLFNLFTLGLLRGFFGNPNFTLLRANYNYYSCTFAFIKI